MTTTTTTSKKCKKKPEPASRFCFIRFLRVGPRKIWRSYSCCLSSQGLHNCCPSVDGAQCYGCESTHVTNPLPLSLALAPCFESCIESTFSYIKKNTRSRHFKYESSNRPGAHVPYHTAVLCAARRKLPKLHNGWRKTITQVFKVTVSL